jgi:uroporphyrinogen decarboxylase
MKTKERFLATMHFEEVDRIPNWEMGFWNETIRRWHKEGLPQDIHLREFFDFDRYQGIFSSDRYIILGMVPSFEEKVIEEDNRYRIWINQKGIKMREFKEGVETSMPQFLDFPIKNRQDFYRIRKERYNPNSPARYPLWWKDLVRCWKDRDYPLAIASGRDFGFLGTLRELMGAENLLIAFCDDASLIHEMMEFLADFYIEVFSQALEEVNFDFTMFFEDMAYKSGSLISPKMFREFMLSPYRRVTDFLREHGVDTIFVDSDGNINELIPLFLEAGVNGIFPLEVQSGMNPVALRKQYGHDLLMSGGIDKRTLAQNKKAIETELMGKLPYLISQGGYIPHIDHGVPYDVPLENFLYYLKLKRKIIEGKIGV